MDETARTADPADAADRAPALSSILQRSILLGAVLAMLLFALPLAVAVQGLYRNQAMSELARDAERARAALTESVVATLRQGGPGTEAAGSALPDGHSPRVEIGVYDATGRRVTGQGPRTVGDAVLQAAASGVEAEEVTRDRMVVAVPVTGDNGGGVLVVRAAQDHHEARERTYVSWAVMVGIGVVVLAVVAAVARSRARRIARPLESLARAAEALGHGDFSVRAVRAGVAEVDAASLSLERTARRLGGVLERERSFSSDASHQLRTPLTAVRLGLESALLTPGADVHRAAQDALTGLDRLERTVLDLLALARDTGGPQTRADVGAVVRDGVGPWRARLAPAGRAVTLDVEPGLPGAVVSGPALRTVLDVLLDNAFVHGAGDVRVGVRAVGGVVLVEVSDAGPGVQGDPRRIFVRRSADAKGTGIGLALARSLVEADGGRLELVRAAPATFAVVLPADDSPAGYPAGAASVSAPGGS